MEDGEREREREREREEALLNLLFHASPLFGKTHIYNGMIR